MNEQSKNKVNGVVFLVHNYPDHYSHQFLFILIGNTKIRI